MDLAGDRLTAYLVPVQELGLQVPVGTQFAGVDQVVDEQLLFLVGYGAAPSRPSMCF